MPKKIMLTGGGTAGSVTPLIGIVDELKKADEKLEYVWLGTDYGPERTLVEAENIRFRPIISGKWRRYFDWRNFVDLIKVGLAFWQSMAVLIKARPDLVVSFGSFVSVPVFWAAWLLRIPRLIHQQDARPGLANRMMAPVASAITVAFEKSLDDFSGRAVWVGNSVRQEIRENKVQSYEARQKLGLNNRLPVVLVLGGGTGARAVNDMIIKALPQLTRYCQVLHITGQGKIPPQAQSLAGQNPNYRFHEFLDTFGMIKAYAAADLVVSRCGMGVLTELSYLGKPSILIPIPDSHQEDNATMFELSEAAVVLRQGSFSAADLVDTVRRLLSDDQARAKLSTSIARVIKQDGNLRLVEIILNLINGK